MRLTENQIRKFKHIYRSYFGFEINEKQALDKAIKLLNLFGLLIDESDGRRKS